MAPGPIDSSSQKPLLTVAVCTRNHPEDLARCLDALERLDYPALDLLVVDNAPGSRATEHLVRTSYPAVRYVCEPRPGLDWARNRAILEAWGEIVAFTDDDVVVDPQWAQALADAFVEREEVMAVTGLVVPLELDTKAQVFFEQYGGFGCGLERKYHWRDPNCHGLALECGTGANMAFRRSLFERIGLFDPALDVGTPTHGGGDIEMFFRVLKEGYMLLYEPTAVVYHRHRKDYTGLQAQIAGWGSGFVAYLLRSVRAYPEERVAFLRLWLRWLWQQARRLVTSFVHPPGFPRELIFIELKGALEGPWRYRQARQIAAHINRSFGRVTQAEVRE